MKNCIKSTLLSLVLTIFSGLVFFTSCTSVDNMLGMDLLPGDQETEFHQALLDGVGMHMAYPDSIPMNRLNMIYLGGYDTEGYGRIESNAILQFVLGSFSDADNLYGYKPTVDSVYLDLMLNNIYGDTTQSQKFYIYPIKEKLYSDSVYFQGFDPEAVADMTAPLFSFVMKGEREGVAQKNLTIEPAGRSFLKELVDLDYLEEYKLDTVFRDKFKGFYFAASKDPAEYPVTGGALYEIKPLSVMSNFQFIDYCSLTVFVHNHKEEPDEDDEHFDDYEGELLAINDTVYVTYTFDDSNLKYPNTSISCVTHDYSSYPAAPSNLINTDLFIDPKKFDEENPVEQDVIYIQGLAGVAGYLDLGGEFMTQLERLSYNEKGEKCIMKVNLAKLYIWLEDDTYTKMISAPARLGMFYDYLGYNPREIPDYSYISEILYSSTLAYGGRLNRSKGYYNMDISYYISDLVNDPDNTNKRIWLAPVNASGEVVNVMVSPLDYAPTQVAIQNRWTDPNDPNYGKRIQLHLSYSLLKE